ncbi:phytanoyl-CoA dioxygenase family protein [Phycisphaeraceae bacterium D3-23]
MPTPPPIPAIEDATQQVERYGFAVVEDVLMPTRVDALTAGVERAAAQAAAQGDKTGYGFRDLFDAVPETRQLLQEPHVVRLVTQVLGPGAFAVRGLLFDKIDGANWHVGWHQDQAIAINHKHPPQGMPGAVPGFGPASIKNGVPHTRASAEILQHMLAVRLHLDDCGEDDGPLRCAPGSHTLGRLDPADSLRTLKRCGETTCTVGRGGALLMRPLCLHASSPATSPSHRRVMHIEFANCELPNPLDWHERRALSADGVCAKQAGTPTV